MKNLKSRVSDYFIYSGLILMWLDICLLATQIQIPSPMCWIMRIYYTLATIYYFYDTTTTNTRNYRKAAELQYVARKRQYEERFRADYEAFRKEMHR